MPAVEIRAEGFQKIGRFTITLVNVILLFKHIQCNFHWDKYQNAWLSSIFFFFFYFTLVSKIRFSLRIRYKNKFDSHWAFHSTLKQTNLNQLKIENSWLIQSLLAEFWSEIITI